MKKPLTICYLGAGVWGFCLARLLAMKGHHVTSWSIDRETIQQLKESGTHPRFPGCSVEGQHTFTTDLREALKGADLIVESVTSSGIRPAFKAVQEIGTPNCPIVLTSKGIEQNSGLILSDVIVELLGEEVRSQIGAVSGPSYAEEVIQGLPTSVVGTGYSAEVMHQICDTFTTDTLRVYPNPDVRGVAYGGALKNIIAIACGIVEGLNLGKSAQAALMTRGLHEMRKLAVAQGCDPDTLCGLAGMGDLIVTCGSLMSRNCRFGHLLAQGKNPDEARKEIGMVVEGAYTCVSALQLSRQLGVEMPITEAVHEIIYEKLSPDKALKGLMSRTIKPEML